MIGKVSRGADTAGLLRYLFGPGRANEHTDPHVVAAWDEALTPGAVTGTREEVQQLARLLDQPLTALARTPAKTVWHCSIRAAPGDRHLSDAEWAEAAREVLHTVGLARRGDEGACRWVAVRHADDHIHLAVTLARQDGHPARASHDFARVGQACQAVEARFGLTATAARDRSAPRSPSRAEREKARRTGANRTPREVLRHEVRAAAAGAHNFPSFVEQLRERGVMVKERHSTITSGEVTGYAVAWPGDHTAIGRPVWYGGGRLSPDLSLPRLQATWASGASPSGHTTEPLGQRESLRGPDPRGDNTGSGWSQAAALSAHAARVLRSLDGSRSEVAGILAATTTLLIATARAMEGLRAGPVTRAAEAYERAGVIARQPPPAASGPLTTALRTTARHLHSSPVSGGDIQRLLLALANLTRAAAWSHQRQNRTAQAHAAQQASSHLHDAASAVNVQMQPTGPALAAVDGLSGLHHLRPPSPTRRRR